MNNQVIISSRYKVMGGEFQFNCFPQSHLSRQDVEDIFHEGYLEVKRIEEKFSDFTDSEFNQINKMAGLEEVELDDESFFLLNEAFKFSHLSDGLFDISFASLGHIWREARENGEDISSEQRNTLKELINYKNIQFDKMKRTIFLPHEKMRIGLGGIGKGYAVDRAFELFESRGLYNFFVNGSGDIRVHSRKDAPRKWKVGIRNPFSEDASKSVGLIQVSEGAVCTSGGYIQKGVNDHHIVNPLTGKSNQDIVSATVLASNCMSADVTGTILINMEQKQALDYLDDQNLIGLLINKDGKSLLSKEALRFFGT